MLQQVLDVLPDSLQHMPTSVAMGIAAGGVVLALLGARLSRSILTLGLVAGGTILGLHLPKWLGWGIDPMGPAFGTAIVLGLSGFLLATLWEGLLLGAISALISGAAVWMTLAPGAHWDMPQIDWSATAVEIALKLWGSLPFQLNRALPVALLLGLGLGWFLVMLWPKVGRLLLYSVAGIGLFVICGALAMQQSHPGWTQSITSDSWLQGACVGWMVLLSCLVQWLLLPRQKKKKPVEQTSDKRDDANQGKDLRAKEPENSGAATPGPAKRPAPDGAPGTPAPAKRPSPTGAPGTSPPARLSRSGDLSNKPK